MCGICGKLQFDPAGSVAPSLVRDMLGTLKHRGPDGDGVYVSGNVGLGHCRLSIIDLDSGQQPLANEDGSIWIVFNGEIYNYQELRRELVSQGHQFRTQSDTEVIVHLYEEHGEDCVHRLRGMFAFAIWDGRRRRLFLARDRVGIKPLYYRLGKTGLSFASEIKALFVDSESEPEVDPAMVDRFLTYFYMPGEETLFRGIKKVAPGHHVVVENGRHKVTQYWDLQFHVRPRSFGEAREELQHLLEETVRLHMISDVPVGFLLSGGVDSTAMLGLASAQSDRPLNSYTLGFSESNVRDERPYARLAAETYRSIHHDMTISAKDFVDFLPRYVWHMEEPVCEPPAIALYYVSRLARQDVKVLISGEGGDEAFAGYQTYRNILWIERLKRACGPMTGVLRRGAEVAGSLTGLSGFSKYAPYTTTAFEKYYYSRTSDPWRFFNARFREFYSPEFVATVDKEQSALPTSSAIANCNSDVVNQMLYVDTKTWLPDDLLVKADKMTMANGLELRVPLLDHKILEFAAALPGKFKVRGFTTKFIAKETLKSLVPQQILDRKKTGFPVPYDSWMRGELKGWLQDLLLDRTTVSRGYFQKSSVEGLLSVNASTGKYAKEIFSLATLELMHRQFNARTVGSSVEGQSAGGIR